MPKQHSSLLAWSTTGDRLPIFERILTELRDGPTLTRHIAIGEKFPDEGLTPFGSEAHQCFALWRSIVARTYRRIVSVRRIGFHGSLISWELAYHASAGWHGYFATRHSVRTFYRRDGSYGVHRYFHEASA